MDNKFLYHLNRWTSVVLLLLMMAVPAAQGLSVGTVPAVNITSVQPTTFDPTAGQQATIKYSISGSSGSVDVDICDGASCSNATIVRNLFNSSNQNPGNNYQVIWNGKLDNGTTAPQKTYLIRIIASNQYGTSIDTDYVTVNYSGNGPNNSIANVDITNVSPNPFDPNNELTTITYAISNNYAAILDMDILDGNTKIRDLYTTTNKQPGTYTRTWDGRDNNGNLMAEKTYTVRVVTSNVNGNDQDTASITIDYDVPAGVVPVITNDFASPNPFDPNSEDTTISYALNTTANVTVRVKSGNNVIETLFNNASQNAGQHQVNWDGRNNSNNPYAEGNYTYEIIATNNAGQDTETGNVTIDYDVPAGVVPVITNDSASPNPFDPNNQDTTIFYTLNTTANVTVRVWSGNNLIETLLSNASQNAGQRQVNWDGRNGSNNPYNEGSYLYEIIATNNAGQDTETGNVTIDYDVPAGVVPVITNDSASPNPFDPNNQDTTIFYTLNTTANVTVRIWSGNNLIETLITNASQNAGQRQVNWDGRNNSNNPYAEGGYTYEIIATNNAGQDTETGNVTIDYDNVPGGIIPVITNDSASPNPFDPNNQVTNISYTLNTSANVTVRVWSGNNLVETIISNVSQIAGAHQVSWDGRNNSNNPYAEGGYTYEIIATNNAGQDTETGNVTIDYDNIPSGNVPVITNDYATPSTFDPYNEDTSIYYTLNTTATVTVRIRSGNTILENLTFGETQGAGTHYVNWDGRNTSNNPYAEGNYTYEITATNASGQDIETGTITIDYDGGTSTGAPNITNDYVNPSTFDPDDELARIYFTIDRSADVTVEIRSGITVIRTLADDVYKTAGTYSYTWNGRDKYGNIVSDGNYTYRITVSNNNGTDTSSGTVRVDRDGYDDDYYDEDDNIGDLISNVKITNNIFDPTENETTRICFDVEEDNIDVTVTILDGNTTIRTLVDRQLDRQNNYCATWNGRDRYNDIVDDDVYRFKILAEKSGKSDETAYRNVEVDTDGYIEGVDEGNCGGFTDVKSGAYCKALEYLKLKGIIQGYPDGTYRPYQSIQRDEVLKVLLLSLGKSIDTNSGSNLGFWDIDTNAWYMPYLRTAVRLGIVRGYPDGSFRPRNNINKVEFAKVFIETAGINVPYCNASPAVDIQVNASTRWYLDYACFMIHNNLMDLDSSGRFNPGAMATRGDIAEVFYRYFIRGNNFNYNYNFSSSSSYYNYGYYSDAQY